ncbi:hypothetical protein [Thermococcus sp.]|uniref:hypothetical protein n=1 Tax=Thermococcus sp. TaxID=35749 RepID=UPI002630E1A2|nr:hypothetical protein [Thermococcus sp.]
MKRALVPILLFILLVPFVSPVSAQAGGIITSDRITVVRGDYSTGTLHLTNGGGRSYRVVSLRSVWVEDRNGNVVSGFNVTFDPRVFSDWGPGETILVSYNVSCSPNVSAGNYTLHLRFLASTAGGSLYILFAKVPLTVLPTPLKFGPADAYVAERPGSPYVFNGERIVVTSHIINIGHRTVPVNASVSFELNGKPYFQTSREIRVVPGDRLVTFIVPVGYDFPEGRYVLHYALSYPGGSYVYSRAFDVRFGVRLVGISVRSNEVRLNGENEAYLTVLSERGIGLNLTVVTYRGNEPVASYTKGISLGSGTDVITVPLVTNVSGNLSALIRLSFGNRTIGEGRVNYSVVAPPVLENVTYETKENGEVTFSVVILNPSDSSVVGTLQYRIYTEDKVLYRDSVRRELPPGTSHLRITFRVPVGKEIYYRFVLIAGGSMGSSTGELYIRSPQTTTTSTTSPTPTTPTSSTGTTTTAGSGGGSSGGGWVVVAVIVIVLLAVAAWYYLNGGEKKRKKRVRPKPRRRSPLGRFKRPKKPDFKEGNGLPKK